MVRTSRKSAQAFYASPMLAAFVAIASVLAACDSGPQATYGGSAPEPHQKNSDNSEVAPAPAQTPPPQMAEAPRVRRPQSPPIPMAGGGGPTVTPYSGPGSGIPGDFNGSGAVDSADLDIWRANFGKQNALPSDGDANFDTVVDGSDFMAWQRNVGNTTPAPDPFVIFAPTQNQVTFDATPAVNWQSSNFATGYDLRICSNSDCSMVEREYLNLNVTSFEISPPLPPGSYFVSVRAKGSAEVPANNDRLPFFVSLRHELFATSGLYTITANQAFPPLGTSFGNLSGADWQCTYAAYNAGLAGTSGWNGTSTIFRAILSISGVSASSRIPITAPVVNTFGTRLAENKADLFDGVILAPVDYDERREYIWSDPDTWTGTTNVGNWSGQSCGTWHNTGLQGQVGDAFVLGGDWLQAGFTKACNQSARLYCVGPAVTE